jgi:hypothetical protein
MNNENELTVDELETITGHFGEMSVVCGIIEIQLLL